MELFLEISRCRHFEKKNIWEKVCIFVLRRPFDFWARKVYFTRLEKSVLQLKFHQNSNVENCGIKSFIFCIFYVKIMSLKLYKFGHRNKKKWSYHVSMKVNQLRTIPAPMWFKLNNYILRRFTLKSCITLNYTIDKHFMKHFPQRR